MAPITLGELSEASVLPTSVFNPPDTSSYDARQLTSAIQELHSSLDLSTFLGMQFSSCYLLRQS